MSEARLTASEAAEAERQIAQSDSEYPPSPGSPVARRRALEAAARAFIEWHLKGQPKTPGTLYPFTYAQQEAWHDEWDKRLDALIAAVAAEGAA